MNYDTNELYHHGVTGMKWGKRNGPPYPLNAEGKASLAKQKKTSGNAGSGQARTDAAVKGKKKNKITITKDSNGRVTSVSGKINVNKKNSLSDLVDRAKNGPYIRDNEIDDPYVKKSYEYETYKKAVADYEKFEKSKDTGAIDSSEALEAYSRLEDAGQDLSKLIEFHSQFDPVNSMGKYYGMDRKSQTSDSYKDKTPEEIAVAKQEAIRQGNVQEVQKNRNYYTDDEIRAAITRHGLNAELKEITVKNVKSGAEKVDAIISAVKKGTALAETGIDAWNVVAKITNSLGGDMPVLDGKKPDASYNVYDKKTKSQLEAIISNPSKYTAKEINGANDAYKTLLNAEKNVRDEKNKNLTVADVYGNKEKYTETEINNAISRSDTLDKLWKNTAAKQEEAESYAAMKAEVFNAAKDLDTPWWDDDKLKL